MKQREEFYVTTDTVMSSELPYSKRCNILKSVATRASQICIVGPIEELSEKESRFKVIAVGEKQQIISIRQTITSDLAQSALNVHHASLDVTPYSMV